MHPTQAIQESELKNVHQSLNSINFKMCLRQKFGVYFLYRKYF